MLRRTGLFFLALASVRLAGATSYTVNTLGDTGAGTGTSGDLRYCITQANANAAAPHTITFTLTGTILLTSPLPPLGRNMTIQGPGVLSLTISGSGLHQAFFVGSPLSPNPAATVNLSDLTIANGRATGGNGGQGGGTGGGAGGMGGAVFVNAGNVTMTNVALTQNQALGGDGGLFIVASGGGGGGGVGGNGAGGDGGTGGNGGGGGNLGGAGGAGAPSIPPGGNGGPGGDGGGGGGAYSSGGAAGTGGFGGGGGGQGATAGTGGFGGGGGGNNVSPFGAPGGFGGGTGLLTGGGGAGFGGAVFLRAGSLSLTNCVFAGNTATRGLGGPGGGAGANGNGHGGGLFVVAGTATLTNCTFNGNTASTSGSDIYKFGGTVNMTNTVASVEPCLTGPNAGVVGTVNANFSLFNDAGCGSITGGNNVFLAGGSSELHSPANLRLLPTAHAARAGTAAGAPPNDLDGNPRPSPPSIGAYEVVPLAPAWVARATDPGGATSLPGTGVSFNLGVVTGDIRGEIYLAGRSGTLPGVANQSPYFWTVGTTDPTVAGSVTFDWTVIPDPGVTNPPTVRLFSRQGYGRPWTQIAGATVVGTTITATGITGFSEFALGSDDNPLPVDLESFRVARGLDVEPFRAAQTAGADPSTLSLR